MHHISVKITNCGYKNKQLEKTSDKNEALKYPLK